ncbi:valine--tRNA ligase, mitochondrial [Phycodurus eques]|uniref:valine--tRNA ligase, mitochondrial n=1 Tax=Phycodurus eques TaxID=693459 RepID=UPI002ACDD8E7|nr:valine--tRNA ligase, mitochondrial [Phycodurus eques]XP_061521174.1 valine--tRNA ligase, mitochondrial [Phycodurus eques]XP_061521175.1 valine--tRNA ligase, mitochondrial [Phycodurus eques]
MWRVGPVLRLARREAVRLCSSHSRKPSTLSASKSSSNSRLRVEKLKRKKHRENAILFTQHLTAEEDLIKWSEKERILYTAPTSRGAKKDTSSAFPSSYSPEYVESSWYQWWEKEGFFSPEHHDIQELSHAVDQNFSLCIPPPNVTGTLHLGHALTVAIEDALVRWRRMQGQRVLWVPGCDHAGIATQSVVERMLLREQGKCRRDFTREEFLQEVWKWKNEKGDEIYHQLRKLGASLDWSRACFTMDKGFSKAVTEAFVRLCDAGLIYRSEGLVNWSCALESAISDIEVDLKELSGKTMLSVPSYRHEVEFGTMLTFAYPIDAHSGEIMVSTTRPETMLGDVAIAVHPDDPRYQDFHGKQCRHPFNDRLLPIVTDSIVAMELGTGAVKVTPAHDHTDFLLSQRHTLPRLTVIGGDGKMTPLCGQWLEGVKRFDARQLVVNALVEKKLFRGKKEHAMTLPICSRSGDVIEPLLKKQWFVRCHGMAQKAIQAVDQGQLEIVPPFYTKTWKNWLSNISDWCISRQLWWGHQIPAYTVEFPPSTDKQEDQWVWGRNEDEARQRASVKYGAKPQDISLTQDSDVLDTWFSSALFPFAMLGWPQQTRDFQRFYPNSILETGSDLIFFWVARMVMLGTELTGQLPFKQVLLHSLVRDKHGRKMSKSLGNVINPLDVIHGVSLERLQQKVKEGNLDPREQAIAMEAQRKDFPQGIPQCGTDALRFALCSHKIMGEDISLSISQVLNCRHFCNKVWQTLRFTLGVLGDNTTPVGTLEEVSHLSSMDQWICSRLYSTVAEIEKAFEDYELHTVTAALYSFWVHNLCDVYMESVKPVLQEQNEGTGVTQNNSKVRPAASVVLYHCVSLSLALLSPIMPFLTEELWQRLQPFRTEAAAAQRSLCVQPYPRSSQLKHWHFPEEERDFLLVQEVIRVARSLRAQCGLTKEKPDMWVVCSHSQAQILLHFGSAVWTLSRVSRINIYCPERALATVSSTPPPRGCLVGVVDHTCQLHLPLQSAMNIDKQMAQLSKRRSKLAPKLDEILRKIQSPDYLTKVPAHIREQMDNKISAFQQELETIDDHLKVLQMTEYHTSSYSSDGVDQYHPQSS